MNKSNYSDLANTNIIDPNRQFTRQLLIRLLIIVLAVPYLFIFFSTTSKMPTNNIDTTSKSQHVIEALTPNVLDQKRVSMPKVSTPLWSKRFDEKIARNISSVSKTVDGYLVTGDMANNKVFALEMDTQGNQLWYRIFRNNINVGYSVGIELDDSFVVSYRTHSRTKQKPNELTGLTVMLHKQTQKILNQLDKPYASLVAHKKGFIGCSEHNYISYTDANGKVIWKKQFEKGSAIIGLNTGLKIPEYFVSRGEIEKIIKSKDGNFIAIGAIKPESRNIRSPWIFKFDEQGDIVWETSLNTVYSYLNDVIETEDGGYLVNGHGNGANVFKFDSKGSLQWKKLLNTGKSDYGWCVVKSEGDSYLLGNMTNQNIWLLKIDKSGSVLWQKGYESNTDDRLEVMLPLPTENIIMAGGSGMGAWIMKTDLDGNTDNQLLKPRPTYSWTQNIH